MDEADGNGPDLPGRITSITPQKKNKERYSIFVDGEFLIGVADETLLEHKLKEGVEITSSFFRKLQRAEGRHAVKSYLLKLLARRDHARKELFDKARRKDYPADIIHNVLDELEERDFINAVDFAGKYARDKSNLNSWGPYKIKAHLTQKGVPKSVSEKAVKAAFSSVDFGERFRSLINKRKRHFLREENAFKRKKKVFDYLQRKGYRPGDIYNYLDELTEMLSDEKSDA